MALRLTIDRAIGAASDSRLSRRDLLVVLAVVHQVLAFSRLEDHVAVSQLAGVVYRKATSEVLPWERDRVAKSLRAAAVAGVIRYEPGVGRRSIALVGVVEAVKDQAELGSETQAEPDRVPLSTTQAESDRQSSRKASQFRRESQSVSALNPAPRGGHSEVFRIDPNYACARDEDQEHVETLAPFDREQAKTNVKAAREALQSGTATPLNARIAQGSPSVEERSEKVEQP